LAVANSRKEAGEVSSPWVSVFLSFVDISFPHFRYRLPGSNSANHSLCPGYWYDPVFVYYAFSQRFSEDPTLHPAFNADEPHSILQLYDQHIYPNCLDRAFNFLEYVYTLIGQLIRDMNSSVGIPYSDYAVLI
jgi:hypothetical protein